MEQVLVVDVGSVYTRGFLFKVGPEQVNLVKRQTLFTTLSTPRMVEVLRRKLSVLPATRVQVVSKPKVAMRRALEALSASGTVVGINLGAAQTLFGMASFGRGGAIEVFPWGVGKGLKKWWDEVGDLKVILRWLSKDYYPWVENVFNYLGMKSLYPGILPPSDWEVGIELAVAREILRRVASVTHSSITVPTQRQNLHFPRLVLSGAVFSQNSLADVFLAGLDGLWLKGIWQIYLDKGGLLPGLGALPRWPNPFNQEQFGFVCVGTVISLEHSFPDGKELGQLTLDLGLDYQQVVNLKSGELVRVPFEASSKGKLSLELADRVSIVGDLSGQLRGGSLGVIVDTRRRPVSGFNSHWREALSL